MKLAIVHDYLNQMGGAERCVEQMHQIWPESPIFTSLFTPETMADSFNSMDIRTTWMQYLPGKERHFKKFLLFYPSAFSHIDLSGYDMILTSSSGWAKGIRKPPGSVHVCYCYTPMRWVWNYDDYIAREGFGPVVRASLPAAIHYLKNWDISTNDSIDELIAISEFVKDRIKRVWNREAIVIYPPVECSRFSINTQIDDYFLIVSRLNTYKKIDIAVTACTELGLPLKVVGSGPHESYLKNIAGPSVEFLGRLDDTRTAELYSRCRAFIFPGEEDFGITPVEAQASGRPVIAFAGGGALETIVDGQTGIFFESQTPESLIEALKVFTDSDFDPKLIRANALRFDAPVFRDSLKTFVERTFKSRSVRI